MSALPLRPQVIDAPQHGCPLMALSRHIALQHGCLLSGAKWTFGSVLEKRPVKRFRHEAMFIDSGA